MGSKQAATLRVIPVLVALLPILLAAPVQAAPPLASSRTDFRQCLNDDDDNGLKDDCDWSTGASNANNSAYGEGDTVGHRLLVRFDTAGVHVIELEYDFTKKGVNAYDFLGSVNTTQPGALLKPCGNLPVFLGAATCTSLFGTAASVTIPSDPFAGVAAKETGGRAMLIGGSSSTPAITIVGHSPPPTCVGNCATSVVTVQIAVSTAAANAPMAIWFGGHLASSAASPGGWGTGKGAASVGGAPFHVALPQTGRDNQMLGEKGPAPVVPELRSPIVLLLSAAVLSGAVTVTRRRARLPAAGVQA